jgi:hypothetical protein
MEGDKAARLTLLYFAVKAREVIKSLRPMVHAFGYTIDHQASDEYVAHQEKSRAALAARLEADLKRAHARLAKAEIERSQALGQAVAVKAAIKKAEDVLGGRLALPDLFAARPYPPVNPVTTPADIRESVPLLPRRLQQHPSLVVATNAGHTWDPQERRLSRPVDRMTAAALAGMERTRESGSRRRSRSGHRNVRQESCEGRSGHDRRRRRSRSDHRRDRRQSPRGEPRDGRRSESFYRDRLHRGERRARSPLGTGGLDYGDRDRRRHDSGYQSLSGHSRRPSLVLPTGDDLYDSMYGEVLVLEEDEESLVGVEERRREARELRSVEWRRY